MNYHELNLRRCEFMAKTVPKPLQYLILGLGLSIALAQHAMGLARLVPDLHGRMVALFPGIFD